MLIEDHGVIKRHAKKLQTVTDCNTLSSTRRCVGCGGVLYCTVYCMPCTIIFEIKFVYFEFYYNRQWFYLLILVTIIDLALLNLKQMLEVLTAQLLGLGVQ